MWWIAYVLAWYVVGGVVLVELCCNDFLPPTLPDVLSVAPIFGSLPLVLAIWLWPLLIPLSIYYVCVTKKRRRKPWNQSELAVAQRLRDQDVSGRPFR